MLLLVKAEIIYINKNTFVESFDPVSSDCVVPDRSNFFCVQKHKSKLKSKTELLTCSVRCSSDKGGQHLDRGLFVGVLLQAAFDFHPHALLHFQQLTLVQPELRQRLLDLPRLLRQAVRHRRHHGRAFPAPALRQQEADVRVRNQTPHGLVQPPSIPGRRGDGERIKF